MIRAGGLVAFPTETVYGLGADATNTDAVRRIFEAKGRPGDNPLIIHIADREQIAFVARDIPAGAQQIVEAFFPGAITIVLARSNLISSVATAGLETVGIRMPAPRGTRAFLRACGRPVAAPSANLSGRPSPTTWQAVASDLNGRIDCILQGPPSAVGLESTVVDCTGSSPVILRAGAVSLEELRSVTPDAEMATTSDTLERSPGTRHRHYAPDARVVVVEDVDALPSDDPDAAYIGRSDLGPLRRLGAVRVCSSVEQYAHELYAFFWQCDQAGIRTIYCENVPDTGLGRAIRDRLARAASSSGLQAHGSE